MIKKIKYRSRLILMGWFNMFTYKDLKGIVNKSLDMAEIERKKYYQKVVDEMARTGTIPPNCDLKLPKASLIITMMKEGGDGRITGEEILAKEGRWLRLPSDGEKVMITYKK